MTITCIQPSKRLYHSSLLGRRMPPTRIIIAILDTTRVSHITANVNEHRLAIYFERMVYLMRRIGAGSSRVGLGLRRRVAAGLRRVRRGPLLRAAAELRARARHARCARARARACACARDRHCAQASARAYRRTTPAAALLTITKTAD